MRLRLGIQGFPLSGLAFDCHEACETKSLSSTLHGFSPSLDVLVGFPPVFRPLLGDDFATLVLLELALRKTPACLCLLASEHTSFGAPAPSNDALLACLFHRLCFHCKGHD